MGRLLGKKLKVDAGDYISIEYNNIQKSLAELCSLNGGISESIAEMILHVLLKELNENNNNQLKF